MPGIQSKIPDIPAEKTTKQCSYTSVVLGGGGEPMLEPAKNPSKLKVNEEISEKKY